MKEILIILKRELLGIFRDKSLFLFFLIPMTIFPMFSFGLEYLNKNAKTEIDICVEYNSQSAYDVFMQFVLTNTEYNIELVDSLTPETLLKNGTIDSYINIENSSIDFVYNSNSYDSLSLTTKLGEHFQRYYNSTLKETNNEILILELKDENGNIEDISSSITNIFIPVILVMLIFQSSSSFANDLFAGEKERKTLELLLLSGVKKQSIFCGKTFALAVLSIFNLLLSLLSFFFSYSVSENGLEQFKFMRTENATINIIFMIILLVELSFISVFLSSTVSMIAKSIKNSQMINELFLAIPVGITVMLVLGILKSNVELFNYIPLLNLLINLINVFSGNVNMGYLIITILSNILLIIAAIFFSVRYMKTEKFLS